MSSYFEKQLAHNKANNRYIPQERQLEVLNQVLKDSPFCIREYGTLDDGLNIFHFFLAIKEKTENSYLELTELANKVALSLYRANLENTHIELCWSWSNIGTSETLVPCIVFEIFNEDWANVITNILNTLNIYHDVLHRTPYKLLSGLLHE